MSIHVCKCQHGNETEYHLRYPGMTEGEAQELADRINGGGQNMSVTFDKKTLKKMEIELAKSSPEFFVREGSTTFLRCDELRVLQDRPGLLRMEFYSHGKLAYTMHSPCDLSAGQTMILRGMEIKTEIWPE